MKDEVAGDPGQAHDVCRGIADIGGDDAKPVLGEGDVLVAEGVCQAGDAILEGGDEAGDGEADLEGECFFGFWDVIAEGSPCVVGVAFGERLLLDAEFGEGDGEEFLFEGGRRAMIDDVPIGEADGGF